MRDGTGRTTSEDRATQLLICEPLSFAIERKTVFLKSCHVKTCCVLKRRESLKTIQSDFLVFLMADDPPPLMGAICKNQTEQN